MTWIIAVVVFLLGGATLLSIFHSNSYHDNIAKKKLTVNFKTKKVLFDKQKNTCPYGFGFLDILSREDRKRPPNKSHRLLPINRKQNFSGALFNKELACLDTMDAQDGQWVGVFNCHGQGRNQMVTFTPNGLIVSGGYSDLCLAVKNLVSNDVILKKCNPNDDTQIWSVDSYRGWLMPSVKTHYCLNAPEKDLEPVTASVCKLNSESQRWQHTLNAVLSLWVDGAPFRRKHKRKGRAKVNKVLLQRKLPSILQQQESLFG